MTRRAKRTKNEKSKIEARAITGPGSCVSVDQLESRTLGLIGHMKGTPTVQRYRCATIYVDHYSRLSYVHLQKQLTSDKTVQGKVAFETFCEARGVTVKHYHANNGRFADKGFVNHVGANRQSISYCGVNAHFQNGMAEKRIRDLQDQTTTMIMHAESRWPDVISSNLLPYALHEANETLNATPSNVTGKVANQMFSGSDTPTVLRHYHPFGCPAYVLNDSRAAGKSIPKWHKRARLGVYPGRSPNHAQSVALILNLATGLVSPQFHLKFDDLFETVREIDTYPNRWKVATHFRKKGRKEEKRNAAVEAQERAFAHLESEEAPTAANDDPIGPSDEQPSHRDQQEVDNDEEILDPGFTDVTATAEAQPAEDTGMRRWSRRHKPTRRLIESQEQARAATANHRAYHATTKAKTRKATDEECDACCGNDYDRDVYHGPEEYEIQRQMADPIAFAASSDPDIMYLHEAMRQPDKKEFVQAMIDEVTTHTEMVTGKSY